MRHSILSTGKASKHQILPPHVNCQLLLILLETIGVVGGHTTRSTAAVQLLLMPLDNVHQDNGEENQAANIQKDPVAVRDLDVQDHTVSCLGTCHTPSSAQQKAKQPPPFSRFTIEK